MGMVRLHRGGLSDLQVGNGEDIVGVTKGGSDRWGQRGSFRLGRKGGGANERCQETGHKTTYVSKEGWQNKVGVEGTSDDAFKKARPIRGKKIAIKCADKSVVNIQSENTQPRKSLANEEKTGSSSI